MGAAGAAGLAGAAGRTAIGAATGVVAAATEAPNLGAALNDGRGLAGAVGVMVAAPPPNAGRVLPPPKGAAGKAGVGSFAATGGGPPALNLLIAAGVSLMAVQPAIEAFQHRHDSSVCFIWNAILKEWILTGPFWSPLVLR